MERGWSHDHRVECQIRKNLMFSRGKQYSHPQRQATVTHSTRGACLSAQVELGYCNKNSRYSVASQPE